MKNSEDKNTMKKLGLSVILISAFAVYIIFGVNKTTVTTSQTTTNSTMVNSNTNKPVAIRGKFKDGVYTGPVVDVYYGNVEIEATIKNGNLADIRFLQHPVDADNSIKIYNRASPILKSEAISSQSGSVDAVSGATQTSKGFIKSLTGALAKAQI